MELVQLVQSAFKNLFREPSRTVLTVLSIVIGVFSVVLVGTVGVLGEDTIRREFQSLGLEGLMVTATREGGVSLNAAAVDALRALAGVEEATPLAVSGADVSARRQEASAAVWGVGADIENAVSMTLLEGRLLSREDAAGRSRVCVLDQSLSEALFSGASPVGKTVEITLGGSGRSYRVVGVVVTGGGLMKSMLGEYVPGFAYLPYATFSADSGKRAYDTVALRLKDPSDSAAVQASLSLSLSQQYGEGAFQIRDFSTYEEKLTGILSLVSALLTVVAGISLVVAGLSIMTSMLAAVRERTREIGIKKSIGAAGGVIVAELLLEAFFLAIIGAAAGILAGVAAGAAGSALLGIDYRLPAGVLWRAGGFAVGTAVVFSAYPARKAAALLPAQALYRG